MGLKRLPLGIPAGFDRGMQFSEPLPCTGQFPEKVWLGKRFTPGKSNPPPVRSKNSRSRSTSSITSANREVTPADVNRVGIADLLTFAACGEGAPVTVDCLTRPLESRRCSHCGHTFIHLPQPMQLFGISMISGRGQASPGSGTRHSARGNPSERRWCGSPDRHGWRISGNRRPARSVLFVSGYRVSIDLKSHSHAHLHISLRDGTWVVSPRSRPAPAPSSPVVDTISPVRTSAPCGR